MADMNDTAWPARRQTAFVLTSRGKALAEADQQILIARIALRLQLTDEQWVIVREIRVEAVHRLRDRDRELLGQRDDVGICALDANLRADNELRVLGFDPATNESGQAVTALPDGGCSASMSQRAICSIASEGARDLARIVAR